MAAVERWWGCRLRGRRQATRSQRAEQQGGTGPGHWSTVGPSNSRRAARGRGDLWGTADWWKDAPSRTTRCRPWPLPMRRADIAGTAAADTAGYKRRPRAPPPTQASTRAHISRTPNLHFLCSCNPFPSSVASHSVLLLCVLALVFLCVLLHGDFGETQ